MPLSSVLLFQQEVVWRWLCISKNGCLILIRLMYEYSDVS